MQEGRKQYRIHIYIDIQRYNNNLLVCSDSTRLPANWYIFSSIFLPPKSFPLIPARRETYLDLKSFRNDWIARKEIGSLVMRWKGSHHNERTTLVLLLVVYYIIISIIIRDKRRNRMDVYRWERDTKWNEYSLWIYR